jgi:hypothetical protein
MDKPYPLIVIIGAVCFAVVVMIWVFTQSSAVTDNAANQPGGAAIPPVSSGPAQPAPTVGAGGATSDSTRGTPGPTMGTERIKP